MSSPNPDKKYEMVIYYHLGILGDSKEAISSFTFEVPEDMTFNQLSDAVSDKLTQAAMVVGEEFGQNLLDYLYRTMTKDNDEDQAKP